MALLFHSRPIASLVTAECACACWIFSSFNDVPSMVCVNWIPSFLTGPYLPTHFSIHPYFGGWPLLDAVDEDFPFVGIDFHAVISNCFLKPLVSCCNYSSLLPRRSISSASRKLLSSRPLMDTDGSEVSTSSASFSELSPN